MSNYFYQFVDLIFSEYSINCFNKTKHGRIAIQLKIKNILPMRV